MVKNYEICTDMNALVGRGFKTILADPPWEQPMMGNRKRKKGRPGPELPYSTMTIHEIKAMPVKEMAADGCHLWLWTTNAFLREGFDVMEAWGFKFLAPIHWIKPSGIGNWFVHRTQTILFGYKSPCRMGEGRYSPNVLMTKDPVRHSEKPEKSFHLIESISEEPRLELFSRRVRPGWTSWGNQVEDIGPSWIK